MNKYVTFNLAIRRFFLKQYLYMFFFFDLHLLRAIYAFCVCKNYSLSINIEKTVN